MINIYFIAFFISCYKYFNYPINYSQTHKSNMK